MLKTVSLVKTFLFCLTVVLKSNKFLTKIVKILKTTTDMYTSSTSKSSVFQNKSEFNKRDSLMFILPLGFQPVWLTHVF